MKSPSAVCFAVLLACAFVVTGCNVGRSAARMSQASKWFMFSQNLGPTPTQSVSEHMHDMSAIFDHDAKLLIYDMDMFYQTDRPTRLSRWHSR